MTDNSSDSDTAMTLVGLPSTLAITTAIPAGDYHERKRKTAKNHADSDHGTTPSARLLIKPILLLVSKVAMPEPPPLVAPTPLLPQPPRPQKNQVSVCKHSSLVKECLGPPGFVRHPLRTPKRFHPA